jgi:UDP:flavonoid glycosyltransferase YjiC (YdhE family)
MGSSGDNNYLEAIIKAILKTSSNIILSGVSSQEEIVLTKRFPGLTNRSIIKSLIDPETILPNCCLTICHGGSGTVYQSLAHGVPVLCFPDNPDQHLVSYAVERQNLGSLITHNQSSEKNIYKTILECINNSILQEKCSEAYSEKIKSFHTQK